MNNISLYSPWNRRALIDAMVGKSIVEIRRYYSAEKDLKEEGADDAEYFRKHGEVLSLHLSDGLTIDMGYYFPGYLELRRSLRSSVKYLVSPDRLLNRRLSIIYHLQNYTSTNSDKIGSYFDSVLNVPIHSVSLIVETDKFRAKTNEKKHVYARGVVIHIQDRKLIVGLGIGFSEYYLGVTVDGDVLNDDFVEALPNGSIRVPDQLSAYIAKKSDFIGSIHIELNDFAKWAWNGAEFRELYAQSKLSISLLIDQLKAIKNVLEGHAMGILDLSFVIDVSGNRIYIEEPFDVVKRRIIENELLIDSIIEVFQDVERNK